jgi:hypothetical protein
MTLARGRLRMPLDTALHCAWRHSASRCIGREGRTEGEANLPFPSDHAPTPGDPVRFVRTADLRNSPYHYEMIYRKPERRL